MPRVRLAGALPFIILLVACGGSTTAPPKRAESMGLKIGLLLDQLREERWQRDRNLFVSRVEELGGKVVVKSSDGDPAKQLADANALLDEGVKVLVVVPTDLEKAAAIVQAAAAKKVPVVSYDRLIRDADVALYVSFDNVKVGRMQAERLVAKAPKGNYVLLGGSPSDYNARLVRDGQMDVLKPLVASGAIEALTAAKLAGQVPVSGQDAELTACQRLVAGTQEMTVYKPLRSLARMAAGAAVSLGRGQSIDSLVKVNNGAKEVSARLLDPISVDKTNLDVTVISDGYHTRAEVYGK